MDPLILIVLIQPIHLHDINIIIEQIIIPQGIKNNKDMCMNLWKNIFYISFIYFSYGYLYGHTSSNNMSDSSVSDTHSGGTARTVSQQTSPSHGTHSSSQSRQDNSSTIFTALFDYIAQGEDELSLQRGETVEVSYFYYKYI